MKLYKPSKRDVLDAVIVAVLLIVIAYVKQGLDNVIGAQLGQLGVYKDTVLGIISALVVALVLGAVGQSRIATMAFAVGIGMELANIIRANLPK